MNENLFCEECVKQETTAKQIRAIDVYGLDGISEERHCENLLNYPATVYIETIDYDRTHQVAMKEIVRK